MTPEFIVAGWALSVLGSGLAAYVGVKVAIAQHEARLDSHDQTLALHEKRIERLEKPFFEGS